MNVKIPPILNGMTSKWRQLQSWRCWLPYLVLALAMAIAIALKKDYYIDEIYSYGLANSLTPQIDISNPGIFRPAWSVFRPYVTASWWHVLDLPSVWQNQAADVHPPFYYLLLHVVSSLAPGIFSRGFAGLINIISALVCLYFVGSILRRLEVSPAARHWISLCLSLHPAIIGAGSFLRMYLLLSALLLAITDQTLALIQNPVSIKSWYRTPLTWLVTAACLTHYYAYVYLIGLVGAALILFWRRGQKQACRHLLACAVAGVASALILFPYALRHVFFADRGTQSWSNFLQLSAFRARLDLYTNLLNRQLFGGFGWLLIGMIGIALAVYLWQGRRRLQASVNKLGLWLVVTAPACAYLILVGISSVFTVDRYMQPLYFPVITIVYGSLALLIWRHAPSRWRSGLLIAVLSVCTVFSWRVQEWPYLYWEREQEIARARAHEGLDCLFLYQDRWTALYYFEELRHYRSVTFIPVEANDRIRYYMEVIKHAHIDELVVAFGLGDDDPREPEAVLNKFLDISGFLEYKQTIWQHSPKSASYLVGSKVD